MLQSHTPVKTFGVFQQRGSPNPALSWLLDKLSPMLCQVSTCPRAAHKTQGASVGQQNVDLAKVPWKETREETLVFSVVHLRGCLSRAEQTD